MEHIERYEHGVADARRAFADDPAVRLIQDPSIGAGLLESFLIHFCAFGVGMTEPVEGWIRRAGQACVAVGGPGAEELGMALQKHARAEADHHLLMIADLGRLCARRDAAGRPRLDPDELLARDWPGSTHRYRAMHEEIIAGPAPWAQIGVENEIEMLSVEIGPGLLENVATVLGEDAPGDLSFLTDHVELDAGHTKFNRRQMATFLDERPDTLDALVSAGVAALDAYRTFLNDCLTTAGAEPAASC